MEDTYKDLLQAIVDDADDTGCEGVYTVSSDLIDKAIEALQNEE